MIIIFYRGNTTLYIAVPGGYALGVPSPGSGAPCRAVGERCGLRTRRHPRAVPPAPLRSAPRPRSAGAAAHPRRAHLAARQRRPRADPRRLPVPSQPVPSHRARVPRVQPSAQPEGAAPAYSPRRTRRWARRSAAARSPARAACCRAPHRAVGPWAAGRRRLTVGLRGAGPTCASLLSVAAAAPALPRGRRTRLAVHDGRWQPPLSSPPGGDPGRAQPRPLPSAAGRSSSASSSPPGCVAGRGGRGPRGRRAAGSARTAGAAREGTVRQRGGAERSGRRKGRGRWLCTARRVRAPATAPAAPGGSPARSAAPCSGSGVAEPRDLRRGERSYERALLCLAGVAVRREGALSRAPGQGRSENGHLAASQCTYFPLSVSNSAR